MVDGSGMSISSRMVASLRESVVEDWDAILVASSSVLVFMYAPGLPARTRGLVYLLLVLAAVCVVFRHFYPVIRANAHLFRARWGLRPRRASPHYVRALFDGYAEEFDHHLMVDLSYRVPNLIAGIIGDRLGGGSHVVADLGCGTGICGPLIAPHAGFLIGVDLSPRMLELAKQKDCYDWLLESDLVDFLDSQPEKIDLCIAADVLVYLGDLDEVFAAGRRALRSGGLFAFTVETKDGKGWSLQRSGRYAHSRNYVESRALAAGFEILKWERTELRTQSKVPVTGDVWLLQKS